MTEEVGVELRGLSDKQQRILAAMPIPSAVLSIVGSSIILHMLFTKSRQSHRWTPYSRLLLAMSVSDIISSTTLGVASFLYPKDTSQHVWAMGNDATCSMIGFLNQFSYSVVLFNVMLNFYFLLTTRFGLKNRQIARRIEPMMHFVSFGYPLVTASVGLHLNVYGERQGIIGCWVSNRCKDDELGDECRSSLIEVVFGSAVLLIALVSLTVNTIVMRFFVWRQPTSHISPPTGRPQMPGTHGDSGDEGSGQINDIAHSLDSSTLTSQGLEDRRAGMRSRRRRRRSREEIENSRRRRLQLVTSHACLFVGSYFVCHTVTYILRIIQAVQDTKVEEMELAYRFFPLLVLQAFFLPLQGLLNMLIYIRPTYFRNRSSFPKESRLWVFRRTICGSKVIPHHRSMEVMDGSGSMSLQGSRRNDASSADIPKRRIDRSSWSNFSIDVLSLSENGSASMTAPATSFLSVMNNLEVEDSSNSKSRMPTATTRMASSSSSADLDAVSIQDQEEQHPIPIDTNMTQDVMIGNNTSTTTTTSSSNYDHPHRDHESININPLAVEERPSVASPPSKDPTPADTRTAMADGETNAEDLRGNTSLSLADAMAFLDSSDISDISHLMRTGWTDSSDSLPRMSEYFDTSSSMTNTATTTTGMSKTVLMDGSIHQPNIKEQPSSEH
eukprot:scaffold2429_cov106-Cylindrotheca_fusiformis.AAC.5